MAVEEDNLPPSPPPSVAPSEGGVKAVQRGPLSNPPDVALQLSTGNGPLQADTLAGTLRVIRDGGIRSHTSVLDLLIFQIATLEESLRRLTAERQALQTKFDDLKDEHHQKDLDCEVLKVKIKTTSRMKVLQQALLTGGGASFGYAIGHLGDPINPFAIGLGVVGIILLFAGWLWPLGFKDKEKE